MSDLKSLDDLFEDASPSSDEASGESPDQEQATEEGEVPWTEFFHAEKKQIQQEASHANVPSSDSRPTPPTVVIRPERERSFANLSLISHMPTLNGEENPYLAPADVREFVLFFSDGQYLVSREHQSTSAIAFYTNKIRELFPRNHNRIVRREIIPFSELRSIHFRLAGKSTGRVDVENAVQQRIVGIITEAVSHGATDIHLVIKGVSGMEMLFRINGKLRKMGNFSYQEGVALAGTIYGSMLQSSDTSFKKDIWQEGQWKSEMLPSELSNIRESNRPIVGGLTMKLRLQYRNLKGIQSLDGMGFDPVQTMMIEYIKKMASGICIIAGPMGSGKTTTLAIILREIKETSPGLCLASIEDPPEYEIEGVEQSKPPHVSDGEEGGFSGGLIRMVRQDVNVMMLGEIRDKKTVQVAIDTALTGHQIWSTTHAKSVHHVPVRFEEMGVSRMRIFDHTLFSGLIYQRLLPTLCPFCKEPSDMTLSAEVWKRKLELLKIDPHKVFLPGQGCSNCFKGEKGATIVAEVIVPDEEYMRLGAKGDIVGQAKYQKEIGNLSLMDHALGKMKAGLISPAEVERTVGPLNYEDKSGRLPISSIRKILGRE